MKEKVDAITVKDKINIFRLKLENRATKNRINRDIRNLLEHEEYYPKPVRVSNVWCNYYIEHESTSDRNKTISVETILIKLDYN